MSPASIAPPLRSKSRLSTATTGLRSTIIEKLRGDSTFREALEFCEPIAKKSFSQEKVYLDSVKNANDSIIHARALGIIPNGNAAISDSVDLNRIEFQTLKLKGLDHYEHGQPCQDVVVCKRSPQSIIAVVSDGAGAVPLSHLGANLLAQESIKVLSGLLDGMDLRSKKSILDPYMLGALHARLLNFIHEINQELEINDFDAYRLFWAATLQLLIITPRETVVLALGDGFIKWQGQYKSIEERMDRSAELRGLNYPPLLASQLALRDLLQKQESTPQLRLQKELFKESKAFSIIAYGPTMQALNTEIILASDGIRFASDLGSIPTSWGGVTVEGLLKRYGTVEAEQILLLMSLIVSAPNSHERGCLLADILKVDGNESEHSSLIARRIVNSFQVKGGAVINSRQQQRIVALAKKLLSDVYDIKVRPDFEGLWDDLALVKVWMIVRPLKLL